MTRTGLRQLLWATMLFTVISCGDGAPKTDFSNDAITPARRCVKAQLKYPEEANFEIDGLTSTLVDSADRAYRVVGFQTTKNGFGVKTRMRYAAVVGYKGGDVMQDSSWNVIQCDLSEQ